MQNRRNTPSNFPWFKIQYLHTIDDITHTLHESQMRWILSDVVISVVRTVELNHEAMRKAILWHISGINLLVQRD